MNPFAESALCWLIWRAFLVVATTAILLFTHDVPLGVALLVVGHVGLVCALVLIIHAQRLDDERVIQTKVWQSLRPRERPFGEGGRRWASRCLKEQMLRFAAGASAFAVISSASAIMMTAA